MEHNIDLFGWKNLLVYIFLLIESYYFNAFTKWNVLFNILNFFGIVKFTPGFMCCISSIISIMFYSAMTFDSIQDMCIKKNISLYYGIFIDFFCHLIPLFYWNYYCLINSIIINWKDVLSVIFIYIFWIRSRSIIFNSYLPEAWNMSHIYVEYNYKIPFLYGLYGPIVSMYFINKKNKYYLLIPIFHIFISHFQFNK